MNMQFFPGSNNSSPETDEDDPARRYYYRRIRQLQDRFNLPREMGPEYGSILKTCQRFGLITHLIFLYRRKKLSKKEYSYISQQGNMTIIQELQRKGLLQEDF